MSLIWSATTNGHDPHPCLCSVLAQVKSWFRQSNQLLIPSVAGTPPQVLSVAFGYEADIRHFTGNVHCRP
jgi:hypothetical protein